MAVNKKTGYYATQTEVSPHLDLGLLSADGTRRAARPLAAPWLSSQHCFYETSLTNVIQYASLGDESEVQGSGQRALLSSGDGCLVLLYIRLQGVPCTCQLPPCGPLRPLTTAGLLPGRLYMMSSLPVNTHQSATSKQLEAIYSGAF